MDNKKIVVARILDNYKLIINVGKHDGVQLGDSFRVMGESADHIIDPVDHHDLGMAKIVKAKITAVELYDEFTICENSEREFSPLLAATNFKGKKQLKVNPSEIHPISEMSTVPFISVGDEVRKV